MSRWFVKLPAHHKWCSQGCIFEGGSKTGWNQEGRAGVKKGVAQGKRYIVHLSNLDSTQTSLQEA